MSKVPPFLVATLLLAGCAQHYDMTLTNGVRVTNISKPVFDRAAGTFTYKDLNGNVKHVFAGRVVEIAPHSEKDTTPGTMQ